MREGHKTRSEEKGPGEWAYPKLCHVQNAAAEDSQLQTAIEIFAVKMAMVCTLAMEQYGNEANDTGEKLESVWMKDNTEMLLPLLMRRMLIHGITNWV